jgi:hypothetical protein
LSANEHAVIYNNHIRRKKMKKFTFSGMTTCTARSDFNVTVTAEDISEDSGLSVVQVEAMTDEEVRAYVEEHMLEDRVREGEGGGHVYDTYYEYDDDMEMVVDEEIFEEVEG